MHDTAPTAHPPPLGRDIIALMKPGITVSNTLMAGVGMVLAPAHVSLSLALATLLGTAAVVASANAFNMWLERDSDARMQRTRLRPLAAKRLSPRLACFIATLLGVGGTMVLMFAGPMVAGLGAAAVVAYAFAYTPLKRVTPWALPVGAIPGAIPPVLGVLAVAPEDHGLAWSLAALLFAWQFPHFLAIAVRRRAEYAMAGIRAVPVVHGDDAAARLARISALSLVPLSLLPPLANTLSWPALTLLALLAAVMAMASWRASWVRPTFVMSLLYLPALFVIAAIHAVVR